MAEEHLDPHDEHINPDDDWPELTAIAGIIDSVRNKLYKSKSPITIALEFRVVLKADDKEDGRHVAEVYIISGAVAQPESPAPIVTPKEMHVHTHDLKGIIAEELDYAFNGDTDKIFDHSNFEARETEDNIHAQLNVDNLPNADPAPEQSDNFLIHLKDLEENN